jgi:hypothetical protein
VTDLVKSVLGGARSLIVGWILPVFLDLQLLAVLILPDLRHVTAIDQFLKQTSTSRQVILLAVAVVAGLVLAAAQAPLYRILEGYILWPEKIADRRIKKHQQRRRRLVEEQEAAAKTERGVHAGLLYERAARYPVKDKQFAPTALGNAIRRFETYAGDRYQLDSQLLWHDLTAAAPERAESAVDNARTNVDFFVCLLYGGAITTLCGLGVVAVGQWTIRTWIAIGAGIAIAVVCYRLAVLATDEWAAAVRALIDHGRKGVADAFGLTIPSDLNEERLMWRAVNTLVRRPYTYSESKDVAGILKKFRAKETDKSTPTAAAAPPALSQLLEDAWQAGSAIVIVHPPNSDQADGAFTHETPTAT